MKRETNWTIVSIVLSAVGIAMTIAAATVGLFLALSADISDIKDLLHAQQNDMRDRLDGHVESLHPRPLPLPRAEKDEEKS